MYSGENIRSRFSDTTFKSDMADNFVCVRQPVFDDLPGVLSLSEDGLSKPIFLPYMYVGWLGRGYVGFERVGLWTLVPILAQGPPRISSQFSLPAHPEPHCGGRGVGSLWDIAPG